MHQTLQEMCLESFVAAESDRGERAAGLLLTQPEGSVSRLVERSPRSSGHLRDF